MVHVVLIVVQCSGGTLHCGYLWFTMVHCGLLHNTEFSTVFFCFTFILWLTDGFLWFIVVNSGLLWFTVVYCGS